MKKNLLPNQGIPLFVDQVKNLPAVPGAIMDSWYLITNFEYEGEKLAFEWHHQMLQPGPMRILTAECLLQNASLNLCYHEAITRPVSEQNGASETELKAYSDWGLMQGDRNHMEFDLTLPHGKFTAVATPPPPKKRCFTTAQPACCLCWVRSLTSLPSPTWTSRAH